MTRRLVILKLLRDIDDPVRRMNLLSTANDDVNFRKASGKAFWQEDMSELMKGFVDDGQVERIEARGKVWYVLTQTGLEYLLEIDEPQALRASKLRRIRYLVRRMMNYSYQYDDKDRKELEAKIDNLKGQIDDGEDYIKGRYYKELVMDAAKRSEYGDREVNEELIKFVEEKVGRNIVANLEEDTRKFIEAQRRREEKILKGYSHCVKCRGIIHRKDVVKVAKELAERLGIETGNVCCTCYDKLMGVR